MRVAVLLFLMLVPCPVFAQSSGVAAVTSEVRVRAFLEPDDGIYVGQLVRLWVEVLSASGFSTAPRYPELQLSGAIVLLPDQFGVNMSTKIEGKTWVGQRQRYAIIPQREGTIIVPPIEIIVDIKNDDEDENPITLKTEPLELSALFPPSMQNDNHVLTSEEVSVEEVYDRDTSGLQVGDAITRTVKLRGENTFALALPTVRFDAVEGTRVYVAKPVLSDQTNRGQYRGTRIDSATYVLEQAGEVVLPEINVTWWNPDSLSIEKVVLPAIDFKVAKNPVFQKPTGIPPEVQDWTGQLKQYVASIAAWIWNNIVGLTTAVFGVYLVQIVWRRYGATAVEGWKGWRRRRSMSEAHFFNEFRIACYAGDETAITHSFWRWVDSLSTDTNTVPTLSVVGFQEHGKWANNDFSHLGASRYGSGPKQGVDGQKFYQAMKIHRRAMRLRGSPKPSSAPNHLNPRGST